MMFRKKNKQDDSIVPEMVALDGNTGQVIPDEEMRKMIAEDRFCNVTLVPANKIRPYSGSDSQYQDLLQAGPPEIVEAPVARGETFKTFVETETSIGREAAALQQAPIFPEDGVEVALGSGYVTGVIGQGGMGRIYKIWNRKLELFRAVKVLLLETADNNTTEGDSLRERMITEAKIASKLQHSNIVEVYDVGEWRGQPFLEMEFVSGKDLNNVIGQHGRLNPLVSAAAAVMMCRGLMYAHSQKYVLYGKEYEGVVHRDLKPANVMLAETGEIKLLDFGIARPAEASFHTTNKNFIGSLQYASPEQIDNGALDHRSDFYAFGTILYEMLSGNRAFEASGVNEMLKIRLANKYDTLSDLGLKIPAYLSKIVDRCMKLSPDDRFSSASNLLDALEDAYSRLSHERPDTVLHEYARHINNKASFSNTAFGQQGNIFSRFFKK